MTAKTSTAIAQGLDRTKLWLSRSNIAFLSLFIHFVLVIVAGSIAFFTVKESPEEITAPGGLVSDASLNITAPPSTGALMSPKFDAAPAMPTLSVINPASSIVTSAAASFSMPQVDTIAPTTGMKAIFQSTAPSVPASTGSVKGFSSSGGPSGGGSDNAFGSLTKSQNNLFTGSFYDLKQTSGKKPVTMDEDKFRSIILEFSKTWDTKLLESYYQSKTKLSTPQIFIPELAADEAPKAFGVEKEVAPSLWAVIYQGSFSAPESGQFRFVGRADDLILVRLNGQPVLDGSLHALTPTERFELNDTIAGPWVLMEKGKNYRIDVLVAEVPGGVFTAWLNVEKKNGKYEQRPDGKGNMLPVFQLSPAPLTDYKPEKGTYAKIPTMAKEGMVFPKTYGL